jgi:UTP--glucose-1-phosphate uridylyltransferase
VRKAVITAAGLGTRFLPATKSIPKEMLPVVDRPAIQYIVEEAVQAGLTDILIITGRGKRAVEDHFDRNFELEHYLETSGKHALLKEVQFASDLADLHYVRQRDPLGLGHAVSVARHHVGDEPFAVLLGDDIMVDDARLLRSMLDAYARDGESVVAVLEVSPEEISSYGCVEPDGDAVNADGVVKIRRIVEKPARDVAPSNLAVIGRYVFTPQIFDALDRITPGAGGELQLTEFLRELVRRRGIV